MAEREALPCPLCGRQGEQWVDGYIWCRNWDCAMGPLLVADWNRLSGQAARIAELETALDRLILAFDVGDVAHATLNGRGYAALAEARALREARDA